MDLPESAWLAGKEFGWARATCFTNGEIGTGNVEFTEPDAVNMFYLNSACRNPNSEFHCGSDVLCFAGAPGLRQGKGAIAKRLSSKQISEDPLFCYSSLKAFGYNAKTVKVGGTGLAQRKLEVNYAVWDEF